MHRKQPIDKFPNFVNWLFFPLNENAIFPPENAYLCAFIGQNINTMQYTTEFHKYPDLHDRVKEAMLGLGFITQTRVQEKVVPLFLQLHNLVVEAPTGTGKTAAYGIPLISLLDLHKRTMQAVVLLPTRELAIQVANALQSFFEGDALRVGRVIGGVPLSESIQEIKATPHILVVVPGRLRDVLSNDAFPHLWKDVKHLIVDEGDKMMESGFLREVDGIRKDIRKSAQVCFFSATISPDAEKMIRERISPVEVIRIAPKEVLKNIGFHLVEVTEGKKERYLTGLLEQYFIHQALIFCSKREEINTLSGYLRNQGFRAEAYFGSQEQTERENILRRFREGSIDLLIASDLAARGLDIEEMPCVINFSVPKELDFYMHRAGRTGRAGKKGRVFSLVTNTIEKNEIKGYHLAIQIPLRSTEVEPSDKKASREDTRRIKCHFSRGKTDKIRTTDIVGFLVNNAFMSADDIGTITIYDSYAIADVPLAALENLQHAEAEPLLKGKTVKVRKYSAEEAENKSLSIKKLLKDKVKTVEEKPHTPSLEEQAAKKLAEGKPNKKGLHKSIPRKTDAKRVNIRKAEGNKPVKLETPKGMKKSTKSTGLKAGNKSTMRKKK